MITRKQFFSAAGMVALVVASGRCRAAAPPPPGTPASSDVSFTVTLTQKTNRLPTQVQIGDVVLLKSGTSRQKSNWDSVLRYNNRPNRESQTGYTDVILDDGTHFRGTKLQSNVVYLVKTGNPFTYTADASQANKPRKATYTVDTRNIH